MPVDRTLRALAVRDFRLYFIGQLCSISGSNAQIVATGWLVLQLTDSSTMLGIVIAAQYVPLLIAAPLLGAVSDRFPKRTILLITQALALLVAVALWLLAGSDHVSANAIVGLMLASGIITTLDVPTRQALIRDVVEPELVPNAVALVNVLMGVARIVGSAVAAVTIATVGVRSCFLVNAGSFLVILVMLFVMQAGRTPLVSRSSDTDSFRSGLRYAFNTPEVRNGLIVMALIGTFTYEFWVTLPVLVKDVFEREGTHYATMMAVMSIGSVGGGLLIARQVKASVRSRAVTAVAFGVTTVAVGVSPTFDYALVAVLAMGASYSAFVAVSNAALQLSTDDRFRGRVMGLWTSAFMGSTAIGGPLMGWIATGYGARWALIAGGIVACLTARWITSFARVRSTESDLEGEGMWLTTRS